MAAAAAGGYGYPAAMPPGMDPNDPNAQAAAAAYQMVCVPDR